MYTLLQSPIFESVETDHREDKKTERTKITFLQTKSDA